jgi:hypothetical protein
VMLAIAESAVTWRSAAILLATRSGHEVPAASAVNAITYGLTPIEKNIFPCQQLKPNLGNKIE